MENNSTCDLNKVEETLVAVLSQVFKQAVPKLFSKIKKKSWLDVFEHRLEYSKYEEDIPSMLQKLANRLNIQGLNVDLDKVEYLRKCEEEAMYILRKHTKYIALKAYTTWYNTLREGENK